MVVAEQRERSPFWFITGNIRVLVVCRVLWSFSTSIVYPFFSLYILALGGTPAQIGLINSLGIIAGMFLYPVGGYIADKMGRVKLVGFSTYAYALSHLFFVFANNWQAVALGQFLSNLFLYYTPAMNALQADSLSPGVRGRGFATIMAIPGSIRIIAPYIGGLIIAAYGGGDIGMIRAVRLCWGVAFVVGLLVATIRLKFLKETIPEDEVSERLSLGEMPRIVRESYAGVFESLKWMDSSLKGIVIVEIVSSLFVAMTAPFWVVYAKQVIGLTPVQWGSILLLSGALGIALAFPLGSLVDKVGPRRMILLAMGLAPAVIFLYLFSGGFYGVAAILCAMSLINGMLMPAFSTIIANMIPRNRRGRLYSLLGERGVMFSYGNFWGGGFLLFPAAALGSFIGGHIYEIDNNYPWIILPAAILFNFLLAVKYIKEPENAET
ncbi:MAG: MFS transporter [Candidatus Bathyarchaeia archaeon]